MEKKMCLNGYWDFSGQGDSVMELPSGWEECKIQVPSPYNINTFSAPYEKWTAGEKFTVMGGDFCLYPEYPKEWGALSCGFYRRKVLISEESRGKRLFLKFDGLSYHSAIYVNGQRAAEEWEGFLPIEIEITQLVNYGGENEIIVGTEKAKSLIYREDGRNRLDYPIGSFWGEHIGGIWQDAWLIERPKIYVSDIYPVTDVAEHELTINYELDGMPADTGTWDADGCQVAFYLVDKMGQERQIAKESIKGHAGTAKWNYAEGEIDLWEPDSPALYTLLARIEKGGEILSEASKRIGFRSFIVEGKQFCLNGRPIKLVIDAWHYMGYTIQTPDYARSYYQMAKELGINIIRLHAQPYPEFFYDIADEMGMLLVSESAVWASHCNFSYSDTFFENSKKHVRRLVLRDRSHPSVVMWSPENECIPAYHVCGSKYIKDVPDLEDKIYGLIQEVQKLDPSRLVSCDGSGDLGGRLPVASIHYPGYDCPWEKEKPITIGEMGSMYYSTPDILCFEHGEKPLEGMDARLEAVAEDAFINLMGERRWAAQICVFNIIWYGLRPFPFTERLLSYPDAAAPGAKPSRITPYMRTINAGMEPNLPEYYPNPVYEMARKAYAPVRFYLEKMPGSMWSQESLRRKLYIYHDLREDASYVLKVIKKAAGEENIVWEEELHLVPCSVTEREIELESQSLQSNASEGEAVFCITLAASKENGQEEMVWEESYPVAVFEKTAFLEKAEKFLGNFSDHQGEAEERMLPCLFAPSKKISFRKPVPYRIFPEKSVPNGKALYFDGEGNPVISYTEDAKQPFWCGIDLAQVEGTEGIRLAAELAGLSDSLKEEKECQVERIVLCEEKNQMAECLKELGCPFVKASEEELPQYADGKTLLILSGEKSSSLQKETRQGFGKVLITGCKAGQQLAGSQNRQGQQGQQEQQNRQNQQGQQEQQNQQNQQDQQNLQRGILIKQKKCFHLAATDEVKRAMGIYGLSLYGLERDKEMPLSEHVMEVQGADMEKLIFLPKIDWRMWNNNAEALKTVSALRSEQEDNSRFCVLAKKISGNQETYYSTLGMDMQNAKQRHLWECLLAMLGAKRKGNEAAKQNAGTGENQGNNNEAEPEYLAKPI